MIIKEDISIYNFHAWQGGLDTLNRVIKYNKHNQLDSILEEIFPDGASAGKINDFLWFEAESIYEWLGIPTEDEEDEETEEEEEE
jgi:hypothetical protein